VRALHWFRSDLRLRDNTALAAAATRADELACVFVLDDRLLAGPRSGAARSRFLHASLESLAAGLAGRGHALIVRRGDPRLEVPRLAAAAGAGLVTWNRDPSPYARSRDAAVRAALERAGVRSLDCKDRVLFESGEVRTRAGGPFRVFTPFRNAWRARLRDERPEPGGGLRLPRSIPGLDAGTLPSPDSLGAKDDGTELPPAGEAAARRRLETFLAGPIRDYARLRDLPARDATSRLSPYLRFGAISARSCVDAALDVAAREPGFAAGAEKWLDELVWREFYSAILEENPRVLRRAFRAEFERVRWEDDDAAFEAWCHGRTGYPFVDAAMRQLRATGWMHNRARMVVASFLVKDLLLDWRRGERFFMERLVDGDPASNNGGWQWAASTGTDAQPWFRIFHPVTQGERFDPDGAYARRFVPELRGVPDRFVQRPWQAPRPPAGYPRPIVDHAERRRMALARFETARREAGARAPAAPGPRR
jgi:deoxyribodipyrimidine photo-lyase